MAKEVRSGATHPESEARQLVGYFSKGCSDSVLARFVQNTCDACGPHWLEPLYEFRWQICFSLDVRSELVAGCHRQIPRCLHLRLYDLPTTMSGCAAPGFLVSLT